MQPNAPITVTVFTNPTDQNSFVLVDYFNKKAYLVENQNGKISIGNAFDTGWAGSRCPGIKDYASYTGTKKEVTVTLDPKNPTKTMKEIYADDNIDVDDLPKWAQIIDIKILTHSTIKNVYVKKYGKVYEVTQNGNNFDFSNEITNFSGGEGWVEKELEVTNEALMTMISNNENVKSALKAAFPAPVVNPNSSQNSGSTTTTTSSTQPAPTPANPTPTQTNPTSAQSQPVKKHILFKKGDPAAPVYILNGIDYNSSDLYQVTRRNENNFTISASKSSKPTMDQLQKQGYFFTEISVINPSTLSDLLTQNLHVVPTLENIFTKEVGLVSTPPQNQTSTQSTPAQQPQSQPTLGPIINTPMVEVSFYMNPNSSPGEVNYLIAGLQQKYGMTIRGRNIDFTRADLVSPGNIKPTTIQIPKAIALELENANYQIFANYLAYNAPEIFDPKKGVQTPAASVQTQGPQQRVKLIAVAGNDKKFSLKIDYTGEIGKELYTNLDLSVPEYAPRGTQPVGFSLVLFKSEAQDLIEFLGLNLQAQAFIGLCQDKEKAYNPKAEGNEDTAKIRVYKNSNIVEIIEGDTTLYYSVGASESSSTATQLKGAPQNLEALKKAGYIEDILENVNEVKITPSLMINQVQKLAHVLGTSLSVQSTSSSTPSKQNVTPAKKEEKKLGDDEAEIILHKNPQSKDIVTIIEVKEKARFLATNSTYYRVTLANKQLKVAKLDEKPREFSQLVKGSSETAVRVKKSAIEGQGRTDNAMAANAVTKIMGILKTVDSKLHDALIATSSESVSTPQRSVTNTSQNSTPPSSLTSSINLGPSTPQPKQQTPSTLPAQTPPQGLKKLVSILKSEVTGEVYISDTQNTFKVGLGENQNLTFSKPLSTREIDSLSLKSVRELPSLLAAKGDEHESVGDMVYNPENTGFKTALINAFPKVSTPSVTDRGGKALFQSPAPNPNVKAPTPKRPEQELGKDEADIILYKNPNGQKEITYIEVKEKGWFGGTNFTYYRVTLTTDKKLTSSKVEKKPEGFSEVVKDSKELSALRVKKSDIEGQGKTDNAKTANTVTKIMGILNTTHSELYGQVIGQSSSVTTSTTDTGMRKRTESNASSTSSKFSQDSTKGNPPTQAMQSSDDEGPVPPKDLLNVGSQLNNNPNISPPLFLSQNQSNNFGNDLVPTSLFTSPQQKNEPDFEANFEVLKRRDQQNQQISSTNSTTSMSKTVVPQFQPSSTPSSTPNVGSTKPTLMPSRKALLKVDESDQEGDEDLIKDFDQLRQNANNLPNPKQSAPVQRGIAMHQAQPPQVYDKARDAGLQKLLKAGFIELPPENKDVITLRNNAMVIQYDTRTQGVSFVNSVSVELALEFAKLNQQALQQQKK